VSYTCRGSVRCGRGRGFDSRRLHRWPNYADQSGWGNESLPWPTIVSRAVAKETRPDSVSDKSCLLKHPVPPTMDRVRGARLLRLGPIDPPVWRPFLRVEEVVVWLRLPPDELERKPLEEHS
jgi:hypothetical protein